MAGDLVIADFQFDGITRHGMNGLHQAGIFFAAAAQDKERQTPFIMGNQPFAPFRVLHAQEHIGGPVVVQHIDHFFGGQTPVEFHGNDPEPIHGKFRN